VEHKSDVSQRQRPDDQIGGPGLSVEALHADSVLGLAKPKHQHRLARRPSSEGELAMHVGVETFFLVAHIWTQTFLNQ